MTTQHHSVEQLTSREDQILRLLERGLTNNEIAAETGLDRNAVRFHIKHLHAKLATEGNRDALKDHAIGRRRWLWLPVSGAFLSNTAAAMAVVALSVGGVVGVRWAHSQYSEQDPPSQQEQIITVNSWDGLTLDHLAHMYNLTEDRLKELNPGIGPGPYTAGETFNVPFDPSSMGILVPTPGP